MRWRQGRGSRARIPEYGGCSSARRTRISRSACGASGSCSGTAAATKSWTRTGSWPGSAVPPASIPDYLALVGDAADGYPGLPGGGRSRPRRSWRSSSTSRRFRRSSGVARERGECGRACPHAEPRSGARAALPGAGDAARRSAPVRVHRRACAGTDRRRPSRRSPSVSTRP